jgi:hypothetical protein
MPLVTVLVWLLFFLTAVWVWFSFAWRTAQFFVRPLYRQGRFGYTTVHVLAVLTLPISCLGILLMAARSLEMMFQ